MSDKKATGNRRILKLKTHDGDLHIDLEHQFVKHYVTYNDGKRIGSQIAFGKDIRFVKESPLEIEEKIAALAEKGE